MVSIRWGIAAGAALLAGSALAAAPVADAPVARQVLVADGGQRVALDAETADGAHAIRVFDAQGKLVRDVALGDFLPKDFVAVLPHEGQGLHWLGQAKLAEGAVEFSVAVPEAPAALHFSIDLRDGVVRTSEIREYLAAADQARALGTNTAVALR